MKDLNKFFDHLSPLAACLFAVLLLPCVFIAGFVSVAAYPLLLLSICSACVTIAWNLVVVVLFHCAPIAFWQTLLLLLALRLSIVMLRPKQRPPVFTNVRLEPTRAGNAKVTFDVSNNRLLRGKLRR